MGHIVKHYLYTNVLDKKKEQNIKCPLIAHPLQLATTHTQGYGFLAGTGTGFVSTKTHGGAAHG